MKTASIGSNMTQVDFDNGTRVLVSYSTPVAAYIAGHGNVRSEQSWSSTTSRHISKWGNKNSPKVPQQVLTDLMSHNGVCAGLNPQPKAKEPKPVRRMIMKSILNA